MDARNRMADVVKLRCNACQDFLKMIITDGWQQRVYDKAEKEVSRDGKYKNNYIAGYEKMRDIGVENYSINDMDVTFISAIIHGCKEIAPVKLETRKGIEKLTEDRNVTNHANENESPEELYLRGLLALCNLWNFIRDVDKYETDVPDEDRIAYRRKYHKAISELKDVLDSERIALVQKQKEFEKDIQKVLEAEDKEQRRRQWFETQRYYFNKYFIREKDMNSYDEFVVAASDAGIEDAHLQAAECFLRKEDYEEFEKRLLMFHSSNGISSIHDAKSIVDSINDYTNSGNIISKGMSELIDYMVSQGYPVEKTPEGLPIWKKKTIK